MDPSAKEYFFKELAVIMKKEYMEPLSIQMEKYQSATDTTTDSLKSSLQQILQIIQIQQQ